LGLVVLTAAFLARGGPAVGSARLLDGLISVTPMLFVPAGVGVIANFDLLLAFWLPLVAVVTLGTVITILVTASVAQALLRLAERRRAEVS
jgi:holin-like protein